MKLQIKNNNNNKNRKERKLLLTPKILIYNQIPKVIKMTHIAKMMYSRKINSLEKILQ